MNAIYQKEEIPYSNNNNEINGESSSNSNIYNNDFIRNRNF